MECKDGAETRGSAVNNVNTVPVMTTGICIRDNIQPAVDNDKQDGDCTQNSSKDREKGNCERKTDLSPKVLYVLDFSRKKNLNLWHS